MHLNLNSFNARWRHERLWVHSITFHTEEGAKETLDVIKEFNKGKDVLYTCAKCEVPDDPYPRYLDTIWLFGYKDQETCKEIARIVNEMDYTYTDSDQIILDETKCPFVER